MQDREQQFEQLFLAEYGRMYRAAYLLLGDADEAKDVVHDVFAQLWGGTTPLREASQRAFLLTCVRNRCLNLIARKAHEYPKSRLDTRTESLCSDPQPPRSSFAGLQGKNLGGMDDEALLQAIDDYIDHRLTPQTSRIIRMHYNEERSYKDIASTLGISLSAVNKHIVQGLRKLREQFKDRNV